MSSQRSTQAIRQGRPARQGNDPRKRSGVRSDARIEKPVSIAPGDNRALNDWLVRVTRNNPFMKTARNLGGLSLTIIESDVLRPALVKRYADYGRYLGATLQHQQEIRERFERFVDNMNWLDVDPDSALDSRVHFLGQTKGGQLGPLCVMVTDRRILEMRSDTINYLRDEEGLDINPPEAFKPHLTIDNVRYKDVSVLQAPATPRAVTLEPITFAAYASHTPR